MKEPNKLVIEFKREELGVIVMLVRKLREEGIYCYYQCDDGTTHPVEDNKEGGEVS